jgi:hypothetical protein
MPTLDWLDRQAAFSVATQTQGYLVHTGRGSLLRVTHQPVRKALRMAKFF